MERYEISAFIHEPTGTRIRDMVVFCTNRACLFFQRESGHILITDDFYFAEFKDHNISEGLLRKLISRGFAEGLDEANHPPECQILPEFFMIDLTSRCNMRCKYCLRNVGNRSTSLQQPYLNDICDYICKYAEKYHIRNISVQPWGGEPLLEMESILKMRKRICPKNTKVHFSIETNGLLLSKEIAQKLYENHIGIGISIDGFADVHNQQRVLPSGKATHTIVEKNLLYTKKLFGEYFGTITTITKNNAPYIEKILDYFASVLNLKHVKFNFVHQSLFFDCSDICVTEEIISNTILRMLSKLVSLIEEGYIIEEHNISVKLRNLLTRKYTDICHSIGCCGGRKMIVFDQYGNIFPCEMTDTPFEAIGNIHTSPDLLELVQKSSCERDFFFQKKAEICDNCEWYVFCRGGCTVRGISCGSRPPAIDKIECAVNRALYPALVELILTKPSVVNKMLGCEML